jgi:hypothetical protein
MEDKRAKAIGYWFIALIMAVLTALAVKFVMWLF